MKNYQFIWKPAFYIFSLLFASGLVIQLEKTNPSDFGKYKSFFPNKQKPIDTHKKKKILIPAKKELIKIYSSYKNANMDSIALDQRLENFLDSISLELNNPNK